MAAPSEDPRKSGEDPGLPPRLGDYRILRWIGGGGMGEVYLARQLSLDREVALKVLSPRFSVGSEALDRFFRESRALSALNHPSIVAIYDAGVEDGRPYISMALVRGANLGEVIRSGGRLETDRALGIARDIAGALEAAHRKGIIHRDIKPENVLIEGDAAATRNGGQALLADFGLVSFGEGSLTGTGQILGTPPYMSPEQALGQPSMASDIYSLGATLYAMLTGRAPFEGSSGAAILTRLGRELPIPVRKLIPSIDRDAAAICGKAMAWDPKGRYASASEMAEDIDRRRSGHPVKAKPTTAVYRMRLWLRRHPGIRRAAVVLGLLFLVTVIMGQVVRQRKSIRDAEAFLEAGSVEEAVAIIDRMPWLPWPLRSSRLGDLEFKARIADGDLAEAVVLEEDLAEDQSWTVGHEIQARISRAGSLADRRMGRSALEEIRSILGGLRAIVGKGRDLPLREDQLEELVRAAVQAFLGMGQEMPAMDLWRTFDPLDLRPFSRKFMDFLAKSDQELGLRTSPTAIPAIPAAPDSWPALIELKPGLAGGLSEGNFYETIELFVPTMRRSQAYTAGRSVELARMFRPGGAEIQVINLNCHAKGDVDGDGAEELVIGGNGEIQVLHFAGDPPQISNPRFPMPGGRKVFSIALQNLQDARGVRDGRAEVVAFLRNDDEARSWIQAWSLEEGDRLRPFGEALEAPDARASHWGGLAFGDVDGDGIEELYVGLLFQYPVTRKIIYYRHPFQPECQRKDLVDLEKLESDVMTVFCGNLDGDAEGRIEIGCVTGPWKGFDLRFWKYGKGGHEGPLRIGPLGSFHCAAVLPTLKGRPPAIFVVKSSYESTNAIAFPVSPHSGIPEGAYLFRLRDGIAAKAKEIHPSSTDPTGTFICSRRFDESFQEPASSLQPHWISVGRIPGRIAGLTPASETAVAISWWRIKGGVTSQFVEVYLADPRRPDSFTCHPIFRKEGKEGTKAYMADLLEGERAQPGSEGPSKGILSVLRQASEPPGAWTAIAFGLREPERRALVSDCGLLVGKAFLRASGYDWASRAARAVLGLPVGTPARLEAALLMVEVECRSLEWEGADRSCREAREIFNGAGAAVPSENEQALADWERLVNDRLRFGKEAKVYRWDALPLAPGGTGAAVTAQGFSFSNIGPIPESEFRLEFDVRMSDMAGDSAILIGIVSQESPLDSGSWPNRGAYGGSLIRSGGPGNPRQHSGIHWDIQASTPGQYGMILDPGRSYRVRLELFPEPGQGKEKKVILRIDALDEPGGKRFWLVYDGKGSTDPMARAVGPVPAGKYRFGLFWRPEDLSKLKMPEISAIELRLRPVGS